MLLDQSKIKRNGIDQPYHLINVMVSGFKNNVPWGVCQLTVFKAEPDEDEIPFRENKFELYLGVDARDDFKL